MSAATVTLIVLGLTVVVFVLDRLPVAVVAVAVALALWATGVLDLGEALAGFGDPTVLFIAALFVVSEGLDAAGVTSWVGEQAMARIGESRVRLLIVVMLMVAALTALINVNGAVAALIPVTVVIAIRTRRPPSDLLMPLAFAAHAGSLLMLTGSPVNLIVSDYAEAAGVGEIGLFSFALVGIPLLLGTIGVVVLFGGRLVPQRKTDRVLRDFGSHAQVLTEHYGFDGDERVLMTREYGAAEIVIPPRSTFLGDTVYPGMVTESGRLVVKAVHQNGQEVRDPTVLAAGDTLLLQGAWEALEDMVKDPNALVVDAPERIRRQAVPLGTGAKRAIAILAVMVVLLATGAVPAAVAGLLAALAMIVLRVIKIEQAYRGIAWTTVILVAGMMSLSTAMVKSGAAQQLADSLVSVVGDAGPYALLAGLFVITAVLSQLISNMATALIVIPIGLAAAAEMSISPKPILMAVAVFAAAALLTPVATPANLMAMEAAGYRFGDYWKLGLPLLIIYGLVGMFLVPVFWGF